MLECMANLVQSMAGPDIIVRAAHMELAEPDIPTGFASCVEAGATEVIAFPYMLSPGRHATSDIPLLVSEAAGRFPEIAWSVTTAFGVHEKLAEVILLRAGLDPAPAVASSGPSRCWHPTSATACGEACREQ